MNWKTIYYYYWGEPAWENLHEFESREAAENHRITNGYRKDYKQYSDDDQPEKEYHEEWKIHTRRMKYSLRQAERDLYGPDLMEMFDRDAEQFDYNWGLDER